ncbi:MAG: phosphate ABC transporter permease PstA [Thioclava marina]|uniref:Phosphate transport system permease protein PstA n=1 Tax=Thioclava marina TaxID=1915077 RepID=A0ABX3MQP1_9RHOB|nr:MULTISPECIES: phosphate ABC transporter permease PstA [Thioclava]MBC7144351.1 phosphate ABC transporter permease PstA [Thioclava marina]OOY13854.1 phosphate ABC transporter, permease protein PstA [Thioclava marina]OOY29561.1 phosphate ABC transporter, permease protein PstA [Thioclava sp. L04-15]TNE85844.1 MAG: phosphate ABC transporter permease PstA [Paracoccaceae bacterium]
MSDATLHDAQPTKRSLHQIDARTKRRNAAESRFKMLGIGAIGIGIAFLVILLSTIVVNGVSAFQQSFLEVPVYLDPAKLDKKGNRDPADLKKATTFTYAPLIEKGLLEVVQTAGIETPLSKTKDMKNLISSSAAAQLRDRVLADPSLIGQTVTAKILASSRVDGYLKGRVHRAEIAQDKNITVEQLDLADALIKAGILHKSFNLDFILGSDASDSRAEQAGIGVSMLGSFYMMLVVLVLALPIGVAASIYLEEFAPKNRFTDLIEVNISNLAAVPSIVFGILGLAVFIQFAHLPQSAPLVGGLVLTLMTLPTIIISTRAALKAVPPSIRDAALGIGASKMQATFHHVLPLAMPGILTGTIIGLAQALGETAPLLLIGMVGFIATNAPDGFWDGFVSPNSAMPAQIYEWAKRADPAFYERAWGGIIILLIFLLGMNIIAIILRRKFERRW